MRLSSDEAGKRRARRLRREMSLPEILLWRELRRHELRFRKQHPAGPYTLDFFCAPARLVIEVDGEAHGRGDRPERDAVRDAWLRARGVDVLRVPASAVLRDLDAVVRYVIAEAGARVPPSPAEAGEELGGVDRHEL
ncbi:endonuclease domain-containing protein [uncultured Sphingomonas sp.]|uniref:endonuclease domain-containing protein n=1 Tax=uncultured Sphingomonas sp. TaxID=158754 RepID=UPI0035CAB8F0